MRDLRILFAGTPDFAVPALQGLIAAGYSILGVYTQPDKPAGRGLKLTASPVKQYALTQGLPIIQPATLRNEQALGEFQSFNADILIVIAYGLILPEAVLQHPRFGCINIHASLLPRWRGAAPIQRAILAGDNETGITVMQMDRGLDTGAVLAKYPCLIAAEDTAQSLQERLALLGCTALCTSLPLIAEQKLPALPQDESLACYAAKIQKAEALLDWRMPAEYLARQVRAFNPWPVAQTHYQKQTLRIWQAHALKQLTSAIPGTILTINKSGIVVATGSGGLCISQVQLPGGKRIMITDLLNAHPQFFKREQSFTLV